ncbi:Retinoic acid induced 16-like protein-domain-containing protein [Parasitella parasitica]|nr:Retinoic acid induced 16-like protein-domain-containing protein [Parasitella parasitica]
MDYFSKFKKRMTPPKAPPTSVMQLAKFHKCWDYVHNIFVMDGRKTNVHVQQTEIPSKLRQMVDLLVDEEARQDDNTTGLCMEYFLKHGILQFLVTMAEKADYPVGIRGEAIQMVSNMIELLDDRFLVHNAVHKPTIKLLRFCVLDDRQSELYSDSLVDLMYTICSKIHGFPALLNIFFHDKHWLTTPQKSTSAEQPTAIAQSANVDGSHDYEFLLFTYLLRFVHREGRSGDYARTGLLFLMEMADDPLGDFILESDFATIMAAGLGALYSQLPRKLVVQEEADQIYSNATSYLLGQSNPKVGTHNMRFPIGLGAEYSNSPEFKYQLDSFLKLLEFCQDVLFRCPSVNICNSLLSSVRTIFLENILYPSILECSDVDGSSVAVMSYIDLILQTLEHDELSKVVVGYLMDDGDQSPSADTKEKSVVKDASVSFIDFTLKDLILSRLKSTSQTTVIATLKLLKTLVTNHCQYSLGLLSISPDTSKTPTIVSHHLREVELYFSLIIAIDALHAEEILACGYEEYLRDAEAALDNDWCYQNLKPAAEAANDGPQALKARRRRSFKYGQHGGKEEAQKRAKPCLLARHLVRSTDPLLQILLGLLSHFFTQSSELNLALTGVISALALCPYRSLEGWIAFSESDRTNQNDVLLLNSNGQPAVGQTKTRRQDVYVGYESMIPVNDDDDEDDRSIDFGAERESNKKTMPTYFKSYPPFFTLLRTLTQQVDYYRSEVQSFDKLLEERRNALISGEISFLDKRAVSPSSSTSTSTSSYRAHQFNASSIFDRRPSILRPSVSTDTRTPILSPSSSASTAMGSPRISSQPPPIPAVNMNVVLNNPMSPLTLHVKKTSLTRIQPLFPSNFVSDRGEPILDLSDDDEHTFAPKTTDPSQPKRLDKSTEITLSMLLNNIVILEETIKELVALMQVRCSLGIDGIAYV